MIGCAGAQQQAKQDCGSSFLHISNLRLKSHGNVFYHKTFIFQVVIRFFLHLPGGFFKKNRTSGLTIRIVAV
jgi:hypothetical protein